jgi:GntR family transcriptional regulator
MRPKIVAPVPRWQQVADYLRAEILSGQFRAGQPLPSEEILSEEFGVSRTAIRQGVAALVAEGLLSVRRPYGTIVRDPQAPPADTWRRGLTLTGTSYIDPSDDGWADLDQPVYVRLDATVGYAALLDVPPGTPMAVREVLQHTSDGRRRAARLLVPFPVLAELASPWSVDGRLPTPVELYGWLAAHKHRLTFTEHVRARMPIGDETTSLHVTPGTALLVVSRIAAAGRPMAVEEIRVPGDGADVAYPLPVTTRLAPRASRRTATR